MTTASVLALILAVTGAAIAAAPANAKFRTLDKTIGWPGQTFNGVECYGRPQGFGPFDYNDPETSRIGGFAQLTGGGYANPLVMVEHAHFTSVVEQLERGQAGALNADIDYTLRAFPNHPRALWTMARYYLRLLTAEGEEKLKGMEFQRSGYPPPECYFQRAKVFAPYDGMVSAIYGIYLHRRDKLQQALAEYAIAEKQHPDHAEILYNIGLLQVDLGDLDKAKGYAKRAKELGYPLSGLQRKIKRLESEASARSERLNQ